MFEMLDFTIMQPEDYPLDLITLLLLNLSSKISLLIITIKLLINISTFRNGSHLRNRSS